MSILDQLFPDPVVSDPAANPVPVRQLRPEDWIISTTAQAAHQAMEDGFRPGSTNIDTSLGRPKMDIQGTINVATSLAVSRDYRKLLVQEQLKDIRFRPTADDVIDGGIKKGSKVIIKIVPESEGNLNSWDSIVRARLQDTDGTPRDLTFDKFSVMSITEPDEQRYQIHETFGADIIQTFGRRPRVITISGQIVNGKMDVSYQGDIRSMDWKNAFQRYYDKHYSAHACTKKKNKVRIFAQDTVMDGYMLNMVAATTAMDQGISQVTITFLLANRNFPRENDDKIPGFALNNGFVLTGKTTPDEYFPQSKIEHYFQDDFTRVIETEKLRLDRAITELVIKITTLDGSGVNNAPTAGLEFPLEDNLMVIDLFDDDNFYAPATGFRLHNLMHNGNTERWLQAYSDVEGELKSRTSVYNQEVNGDPNTVEVAPPPDSDNITVALDFSLIKSDEANLRIWKRYTDKRVTEINRLCVQLEDLEREKDNLLELENNL